MEERRSQVCLGIDPDPASWRRAHDAGKDETPAAAAARAAVVEASELIARAGPSCVAAKLQLACFERLGAAGWEAMARVAAAAREAGLLVIADGKRGDIPVTAAVYAESLFGSTETPWGCVDGLGADAATVNPLLGADALEPFLAAAEPGGAGVFALVRTSNPGAGDFFDFGAPRAPLHERIAGLLAERADRLLGESGLSGLGAVIGATEPERLGRLRELLPRSIFLLPGVGAQGGRVEALGPAFAEHPASALVPASRSIARADDPGAAAEELRIALWRASQRPAHG